MQHADGRRQAMGFVTGFVLVAMLVPGRSMIVTLRMPVTMAMVVVMAAAEEPGAGYVHRQAEACDRDRLPERDGDRREEAAHCLVSNEDGDHRQHDGAGEAGEIAELARSESEPRIASMLAGVGVRQRGE